MATRDINDKKFFSDENMNAIGEAASYSDWAPGPNEDPSRVTRGRPAGDYSTLNIGDGIDMHEGGSK